MAERFKTCGGGGCCPEGIIEDDGSLVLVEVSNGSEGLPPGEFELAHLTREQADNLTRALVRLGYGK